MPTPLFISSNSKSNPNLENVFFFGLSLGWFSSVQFRQVFWGGLILTLNYISVGRVSGGRRKPGIKAGQRYPSYLERDGRRTNGRKSLCLILEDTARYVGLLLAPAEGFSLWQSAFFAFRAKKDSIMLFWSILGHLWCPLVTLVTFRSNLNIF